MRAGAVVVCGVLAACGGGDDGLSEDEADDAVETAIVAVVDELDREVTNDASGSDELRGALESWAECGAGGELPDARAEDSTVVEDEEGPDTVVVVAVFENDVEDAVRGTVEDEAVDCFGEELASNFPDDMAGDFEVDADVEAEDVGDAGASIEGTLSFDAGFDEGFVGHIAAVGPAVVAVGSRVVADETSEGLDDARDAAIEALEEVVG